MILLDVYCFKFGLTLYLNPLLLERIVHSPAKIEIFWHLRFALFIGEESLMKPNGSKVLMLGGRFETAEFQQGEPIRFDGHTLVSS